MEYNEARLFRFPLASKTTMAKALWSETGKTDRVKVATLFLVGKVKDAKKKMLSVMNSLGLAGLNRIILDNSGAALCCVLKVVADRHNHPVMIHCSHGKDRTGLVITLVLAAIGVPADKIMLDYTLSAKHGQSEAGRERMRQINPDLDIEHFTSAPPEVVTKTLEYIETKWGSVPKYLDSIGFTQPWQDALKNALTAD